MADPKAQAGAPDEFFAQLPEDTDLAPYLRSAIDLLLEAGRKEEAEAVRQAWLQANLRRRLLLEDRARMDQAREQALGKSGTAARAAEFVRALGVKLRKPRLPDWYIASVYLQLTRPGPASRYFPGLGTWPLGKLPDGPLPPDEALDFVAKHSKLSREYVRKLLLKERKRRSREQQEFPIPQGLR